MDISTGDSKDAGSTAATDAAAAAATVEGGVVSAPGVTGVNCARDTSLGITLCQTTTQCPNVIIDQSVYPGCGWRIVGNIADLQCDCNGLLCPIGTPTTCGQAVDLISNQSQGTVCQGVSEGRCTQPGSAGGGSSGGGSSTCDKTCAADCGGNASCLQLCGC
jgi:uncharacterized membrane protein YgcG